VRSQTWLRLLVPGGRVLNPQSYHSAFRISSTRYEEALAEYRLVYWWDTYFIKRVTVAETYANWRCANYPATKVIDFFGHGVWLSWREPSFDGDQRIAESVNLAIHLSRIRNRATHLLA
jgi:hypothetical protein